MENLNHELANTFLRKKPAQLIVFIKKEAKPYASLLAKRIDATYAHTVKILAKMHSLGLVEFKKEGRVKHITLTPHGNDLADEFEILLLRRMAARKTEEVKTEQTETLTEETEEKKKRKKHAV